MRTKFTSQSSVEQIWIENLGPTQPHAHAMALTEKEVEFSGILLFPVCWRNVVLKTGTIGKIVFVSQMPSDEPQILVEYRHLTLYPNTVNSKLKSKLSSKQYLCYSAHLIWNLENPNFFVVLLVRIKRDPPVPIRWCVFVVDKQHSSHKAL